MTCAKCQGMMSFESFEDLQDDTGEMRFNGWRCMSCGDIIDGKILSHRQERIEPIGKKTKSKFKK